MGWVFWLTIALKALVALLDLLDSGRAKAMTPDQAAKLAAVLSTARSLDRKAVSLGVKAATEA